MYGIVIWFSIISDTSRPRRDKEVEGVDYHFITKTEFESDILNRKFVEHGEFEKAYYGTSFESIRDVIKKDKICVLNLHPLSLKMLKNSDLMPYVVFVAPPSLDVLRQRKKKLGDSFKVCTTYAFRFELYIFTYTCRNFDSAG